MKWMKIAGALLFSMLLLTGCANDGWDDDNMLNGEQSESEY